MNSIRHRQDSTNVAVRTDFAHLGRMLRHLSAEGYYTVGGGPGLNDESGSALTRHSQKECPQGHYCVNGTKIKCPKGKYGTSTGLYTSECDGDCDPGYYCDAASPSRKQHECGHHRFTAQQDLLRQLQ